MTLLGYSRWSNSYKAKWCADSASHLVKEQA